MRYEILSWDSDFFGIKVGKIIPHVVEAGSLRNIIKETAKEGIKLVYWSSAKKVPESVISEVGGLLVDVKTTLITDLKKITGKTIPAFDIVKRYSPAIPIDEFYSLAVQCGGQSRFFVDPNISKEKSSELYRIWIRNSLNKEMADEVLVILNNQKLIGFVTVLEDDGQGTIGLIAVDKHSRRLNYGEKLVRAAQNWFLQHGCRYGSVVTQGENAAAINLYKKCDFSVEKQEYFYHFWL